MEVIAPGPLLFQMNSFWNGRPMRELRRKFLAGEQPEGCKVCFAKEQSGGQSHRQKFNRLLRKHFPSFPQSDFQEVAELKLLRLSLSTGNICDLKCRTCNPRHSSKWIQEVKSLSTEDRQLVQNWIHWTDENPWSAKAEYLAELVLSQPDLKHLTIQGGEPLVSPEFVPFLKKLVEAGVASGLEINLATNGGKLSQILISLMQNFKRCYLNLSVDGPPGVHDYVRGADFSHVENALQLLAPSSIDVIVAFTLSALNALDLPEFLDCMEQIRTRIPRIQLSIGTIFSPSSLQLRKLSKASLEDLIQKIDNHRSLWAKDFLPILSSASQKATDSAGLDLLGYVEFLDRTRKQSAQESVPRLADILRLSTQT